MTTLPDQDIWHRPRVVVCRSSVPGRARYRVRLLSKGMRRFRQVTAIFTHLLMLQYAAVSGTMACAVAGVSQASAGGAAAGERANHAGMHHDVVVVVATAVSSARDGTHEMSRHAHHECDHCTCPCTAAGCSMSGHCGSSAVPVADAAPRSSTLGAAVDNGLERDRPASARTAPEPPPPRA